MKTAVRLTRHPRCSGWPRSPSSSSDRRARSTTGRPGFHGRVRCGIDRPHHLSGADESHSDAVDPSTVIYDFEGELFFGAAPELERYLEAVSERVGRDGVKFVVLRMKRVRHPDGVVVERIERFLREETERGVNVLLAGIQRDMWAVLKNVGFDLWFPPEHVLPEEDKEFSATLKAVRYAHAQLDSPEPEALLDATAVAANGDRERYYYLV